MQADGRLVENVKDAAEARANLRGEADALGFATGKRSGGAVEAEIAEADSEKKVEALGDLFERPISNLVLAGSELREDFVDGGASGAERKRGEVGDGPAGELDG